MDGPRFDRLSRLFATTSRRSMVRLAAGSGVAALGLGIGHEVALACRKNGKPCGSGPNGNCCSGTCKKGTCRPTPGAAGCQVNSGDACTGTAAVCPKKPSGLCILLDNGKPFCYVTGECVPCVSNADCTNQLLGNPGKCIKTCGDCQQSSDGQFCAYAKFP